MWLRGFNYYCEIHTWFLYTLKQPGPPCDSSRFCRALIRTQWVELESFFCSPCLCLYLFSSLFPLPFIYSDWCCPLNIRLGPSALLPLSAAAVNPVCTRKGVFSQPHCHSHENPLGERVCAGIASCRNAGITSMNLESVCVGSTRSEFLLVKELNCVPNLNLCYDNTNCLYHLQCKNKLTSWLYNDKCLTTWKHQNIWLFIFKYEMTQMISMKENLKHPF
jgi:hypothetical protein